MTIDADDLGRELKGLRKGRGLSPKRFAGAAALRGGLADADDPYETFKQMLVDLGDSVQARALRNAFGLGLDDPKNLTRRRADFGEENGHRHPDTIEAYENEMIDELTHALLVRSPGAQPEELTEAEEPYDVIMDWVEQEMDVADFNVAMQRHEDAASEDIDVNDPDVVELQELYDNHRDEVVMNEAQQRLVKLIRRTDAKMAARRLRTAALWARYRTVVDAVVNPDRSPPEKLMRPLPWERDDWEPPIEQPDL